MSERIRRIRSMFDPRGVGLEIGPSHSPIAPRADGFRVEILDYLDADGLRRKYGAAGVDVSRVEEVDYVGDGRSLVEVIGKREAFDWIIASHVIEHVPDLVTFVRDCEALLKPGGRLVLAVPDKRCCFDILRPVSTIGQVMQAHLDRRAKPSPGIVLDDTIYAQKRAGDTGWPLGDERPLGAAASFSEAWQVFNDACANAGYIDMHCWVFVPASFRLIVSALYLAGKIRSSIAEFEVAAGEFLAVLSDIDRPEMMDLGELAAAAQREERQAAIDRVLADAGRSLNRTRS